jgi:hypothetical protein
MIAAISVSCSREKGFAKVGAMSLKSDPQVGPPQRSAEHPILPPFGPSCGSVLSFASRPNMFLW